jgi:nucleoside-diphosphate-sugar epimerase
VTDPAADLTVAVTGPTGTFGAGLVPLLQSDDRITKVVGIARRPFDPQAAGWTKMDYRQGDVRDEAALTDVFAGADVVVHLAFLIVGGRESTTRAINVDGTLNAFRAAAAAKVRRFVYASSVAAYGFHRDNPVGMTEQWPVRPAERLFYAREKAEIEQLLQDEAASHPEIDLYLLRPSIVLGPHAVGAKDVLPWPLEGLSRPIRASLRRFPLPLPVIVPDLPLQLVHEADVGSALLQCVLGSGPPGAYNIAGDGFPTVADVARELGLHPIALPAQPAYRAARALARLPLPAPMQWIEALSHPAVMDTTHAKDALGWRPHYTAIEALQATLD